MAGTPEADMCRAFVDALRDLQLYHQIINPDSFLWYHIPNGQSADEGAFFGFLFKICPQLRTFKDVLHKALLYARKIAGAKDKALGAMPGVPDYFFMWRDSENTPFIGYLEAKSKTGELSKEQGKFRAYCMRESIPYAEFRDHIQGLKILQEWGVIKEGAIL